MEPDIKLRKCSTNDYIQDSIFDFFDIKKQIEKKKSVNKCIPCNFLFSGDTISNENDTNLPPCYLDIILSKNEIGGETKLTDEFEIIKVLGQGSFGTVISVYDKKIKSRAALKIIKKKSNFSYEEVHNLSYLNHDNIIKFYRSFETSSYLFIVMELMEGGSLKDLIVQRYYNEKCDYFFTEEEASIIMSGILCGVEYLHDKEYSHRDIKPGKFNLT